MIESRHRARVFDGDQSRNNKNRKAAEKDGPSRLTCENCRDRKVKCDRQYPACNRCSRLGYRCSYRDRVSHRTAQAAVIQQLEERVREAEARLALHSAGSAESSSLHSSQSPATALPSSASHMNGATQSCPPERPAVLADFDFSALDTTSYDAVFDEAQSTAMDIEDSVTEWQMYIDQLPTPTSQTQPTLSMELTAQDLAYLHGVFFYSYSTVIPILAKDRFYREQQLDPDSAVVKSVSYSIALLAITVCGTHQHMESICYANARRYIDDCEIQEGVVSVGGINLLQALLFLTRYEVGKQKCARSYLTLARASHLVRMMRLDQMDKGGVRASVDNTAPHIPLPETRDIVELEERRRCFWAWYLLEGYSGVHTGRPTMQDDETISVSLPSVGNLDASFDPSPMPYITETNSITGSDLLSPLAGAVLVVSLVRKVLDHAKSRAQPRRPESLSGFWDRHYNLVKSLDTLDALIKPLSTMRIMSCHPLAFDLHILFRGAEIHLWEVALNEGAKQGLPAAVSESSAKRLLNLAQKAATTIRSTWPQQLSVYNNLSLSGAFVAWPISGAIKALRTAPSGTDEDGSRANMISMLYEALGTIEKPEGPWHRLLASGL
ncbi:hypothetical protein F4778DRAFT_725527 [Xylariomycetidae sp. FL2044]|nr:hypothetical protein F4778DRAFT_725527 [Xylariomycetidae sp. FL2044]